MLFDEATERNDSLWSGNTHTTANVYTYYIASESKSTTKSYTFNHATGAYSTTCNNSGDGTVYSASMDDIYPGRTYFVNANHNDLVKLSSTPNIIGFPISIIIPAFLIMNG